MKNISSLLSYLKNTQLSDGSFENSPFQTSLILVCLAQLKNNTTVQLIVRNAMSYIFSQASLRGSWNYWDRSHQKSQTLPDDLDDTAMALLAISLHESTLINEELLLSFVNHLITNETQEGGPYFTWMIPDPLRTSWDDVDLVVNSNISFFLKQQKIHLEPLDMYLETAVNTQNLTSKYYNQLHHYFFLSRTCTSSTKKTLMKLLVQTYPTITTLLDRALFVITYLNLGGSPEKLSNDFERLSKIAPQHLSADPFYIEEIQDGVPQHAGSQSLTAAYIIQALTTYNHHIETMSDQALDQQSQHISQISHMIVQRFSSAPKLIRESLVTFLKKIRAQKKASEIFLLPLLWYQSLHENCREYFTHDQVLELCSANVLGWIGFGIYDDVIDGEHKQHLLPLANVCMREVLEIFQKLTPSDHFMNVRSILDRIDYANTWEQDTCRLPVINNVIEIPNILPDYKNLEILAHKSLGHGIGPILVTLPKRKKVQQFFIHYLIARQLNDDAHDWFTDLEQGFLNPVSVRIIKRFRELYPTRAHINLTTDQDLLRSIFWYEVIDSIVDEILLHTQQARSLLKKPRLFTDTTIVDLTVLPLEQSAHQALAERDSAVRFLEKYR